MPDLPVTTDHDAARIDVRRWGTSLTHIDWIALELLAACIVNLSRRKSDGWTGRDLLLETTLPRYRFDRDLLRDGGLVEGFFETSKADMLTVMAVAQYIIIKREQIELDNIVKSAAHALHR